jgi:transposase-like protein
MGQGNISIHGRKRPRYKCQAYKKTFSAKYGAMMEGLRTDVETITKVVILVAYGCPTQVIVHAFELDERTVTEWQKRARQHCERVHKAIVEQGHVKR